MDGPLKVSVVVPTYNRAHSVGEAIRSVLRQTYADLELIVVDDGSSDDTAARVQQCSDSRVRYIRQENAGVSAARNRGVSTARGELIAFIDSDDVWKPEKLAVDVAVLDQHPEAQAVFSDVEKHDGAVIVPSFTRETTFFKGYLAQHPCPDGVVLDQRQMLLCLLQEVPILPSTLTMRRAAFEKLGGFDTSWRCFEDWEFFIRFNRTERFGYIDRQLTILKISPDSLHRVLSVVGRTAIVALLLRERARLRADPEARAAIREGVLHQRRMMGWQYAAERRRLAALQNYVRGFQEIGAFELLLRSIMLWMPQSWKAAVRAVAPSTLA
jgi:glycosyltransferase involved in cell wall biosynthesis